MMETMRVCLLVLVKRVAIQQSWMKSGEGVIEVKKKYKIPSSVRIHQHDRKIWKGYEKITSFPIKKLTLWHLGQHGLFFFCIHCAWNGLEIWAGRFHRKIKIPMPQKSRSHGELAPWISSFFPVSRSNQNLSDFQFAWLNLRPQR